MSGVGLKNLTVRYGSFVALDDVSVEVGKGELFFLLGPSGCGKSTLLRTVAGFVDPHSGDVTIGDKSVREVPAHRRDAGMVFQNYALFPHLTVAGNVAFGLRARKVPHEEQAGRVAEALDLVGLKGLEARRPGELSGGQQQRVALARALVIRPEVLLLDEPLSNLDARLRLEMREEIRRIHRATGFTTLYVTHDQKEALSLADCVALLDRGRISALGTPESLYYDPPNAFAASFMGEMNVIAGKIESSGGTARAVTPLGAVAGVRLSKGRAGSAPSSETKLFCRPESVRFAAEDAGDSARSDGGALAFRAKVVARAFQGDHCLFVVELPGGERWKAIVANPRQCAAREGETVACRVSAEDLAEVPPEK